MAVENIAAASSASDPPEGSGRNAGQDRISVLIHMEQDIRKMRSDLRSRAENSGMSQSEIDGRIREFDRLIAKIEREIRKIRLSGEGKSAGREKTSDVRRAPGAGPALRADSAAKEAAALRASYQALIQPAAVLAPPREEDRAAVGARNLDRLV